MSSSPSSEDRKLSVFVNFPSLYTHSLILSALTSVLPSLSLSFEPPNESNVPDLQWADYDLLCLDTIQSNPSTQLISSYVYRKTLIRKHMLHAAIQEYLAKQRHRGTEDNVLEKAIPRGWAIDIQFADELDGLMVDELYDLREDLQENETAGEPSDRKTAIFESFEPESDDEEDDEEENESVDEDAHVKRMKGLALKDFPDDESCDTPDADALDEDDGQLETGVQTSQLRHFVIQFHLRAYVMMTGTYQLYLSKTMLALFSDEAFSLPAGELDVDGSDLRAHLTNTCLQDANESGPPEHLVKLFWELEGQSILSSAKETSGPVGKIDNPWLQTVFNGVGDVVAETVKAAAECGSFGLQLMPNAFEIFGVDLLLSFDPVIAQARPIITLLEFNASPDFTQSGNRLREELAEAFKGVIKLVIAPFFDVKRFADEGEEGHETFSSLQIGEEKYGWKKIGEQETRGTW
ncbi:hypothetical protein QFC21_005941 [Naganishia friedmannii]|uniref:Uncharacterized protein n=1 Tax=Naganishia friedmannii TaxID=89922 RepID=A0ACC2V569_9TREE|nr:hypothetical protein QFC21_005941 [Naganishia friedmannii]